MKKERKKQRKIILIVLSGILCLIAGFIFLYSIKQLLLSEEKMRICDINKQQSDAIAEELRESPTGLTSGDLLILNDHNTKDYFKSQAFSYITDNNGYVLASFGEPAAKKAKENNNSFHQIIGTTDPFLYRLHVKEDQERVEQIRAMNGEKLYVAVRCNEIDQEGYIITIVEQKVVKRETNATFQLAVMIVILAVACLVVGASYSLYKERKTYRKQRRNSDTDEVTGLVQYPIHKTIGQKLISSEKNEYAYVSLAINKYSLIAGLNGMEYCRKLQRDIAHLLSECVNEDETLAHMEDDIFGMLLIYNGELMFRKRLIHMFKYAGDIKNLENNFCNIAFHAGVCVVAKETDINRVISRAVRARTGHIQKNATSITFYQNKDSIQEYYQRMADEVSDALYHGQFLIYFQPKYHMKTQEMAGAEALIRWNHPENGLLYPSIFLPVLEENNMIMQIDYYVIRMVCEHMRKWIMNGYKVGPVSVNISSKNLHNSEFCSEITEIIDTFQIPHNLIEFEFEEGAIYEQMDDLREVMNQLDQKGFTISVDNLGTGFSAVHLMKELPIHILKIDKELIRDLDDTEFADKERTMVTHIISYAKARNMQVVAQGVETQEQNTVLMEQDCDMIQGYYYQKPMPPEDYEKLLVLDKE